MTFKVPEHARVTFGGLGSNQSYGCNGAFQLKCPTGAKLFAIVSDGEGWEHVSVTVQNSKRNPSWAEMCWVKNQFWDEEDCAMQFHPPKSEYVNNHQFCLHLWRPTGQHFPTPASILVGYVS